MDKQLIIDGLNTGIYITECGKQSSQFLKIAQFDGTATHFVKCSKCETVLTTRGNQLSRHAKKTCPTLKAEKTSAPLLDSNGSKPSTSCAPNTSFCQSEMEINSIAEYFVSTGLPLSHSESAPFKRLASRLLFALNPQVAQPPSELPATTVIGTAVDVVRESLFKRYADMITKAADEDKVCLQISRQTQNGFKYIAVFANWIDDDGFSWEYRSIPLVVGPYCGTSESIFQTIVQMAEKIGVSEEVLRKCKIAGDRSGDLEKIGNQHIDGYVQCKPQVLGDIAEDVLKPKQRDIANFNSNEQTSLKTAQRIAEKSIELAFLVRNSKIKEVLPFISRFPEPTHWLSVLYALDDVLLCLPHLHSQSDLFTSIVSPEITQSLTWLAENTREIEFIKVALEPIKEPFIQFKTSTNKVMLPFVAPTYYVLLNHFKKLEDDYSNFKFGAALGKAGRLATEYLINDLTTDHYCASFLNPATRKMKLYPEEIKNDVIHHMSRAVPSTSLMQLLRQLQPPPAKKCFYEETSDDESDHEIKIYLMEPNSLQLSIEQFWPMMKIKTPALYEYAIRLLVAPASLPECDHLFRTLEYMRMEDPFDTSVETRVLAKLLSSLEASNTAQ